MVASTARKLPTHCNFAVVDQSTPRLDLEVVVAHVGVDDGVFVMRRISIRKEFVMHAMIRVGVRTCFCVFCVEFETAYTIESRWECGSPR